MPLAPATRLGSYEIIAPLGAGGMGEVYRAKDLRLGREIALKVLPAERSADAERLERFEREARTLASINHPNIVTVHSVEEEGGVRFITMELVEGQSLDQMIVPGGLPIPRLVELGVTLADALAGAHERGLVHRDLKPANVMLSKDGRIKVLDFGLAKLMRDETDRNEMELTSAPTVQKPLTSAGMVMGTVPYMSPEQLNGAPADARSDVFSLGVMLYEMATGERPFRGKTQAETISSILRDAPAPLTQGRPGAPPELARILDRCLQKDPDSRFQTARELRDELQALRRDGKEAGVTPAPSTRPDATVSFGLRTTPWIIGAAILLVGIIGLAVFRSRTRSMPPSSVADAVATTDPRSIAVLPFVNMSSDKEQEYFSDGISEELLNLLSKVPSLKVAARTSSFSFKGKDVEVPEIARLLHVAHVLEGSVRKSGEQIRITVQLIHAADGFHLWSQTYDRKLDDIFRIQDEIAGEVVKELKVTLLGPMPRSRTTDPRAYALYVQGVQLGSRARADAFATSDSLYRETLKIDPRYVPAWDGLAKNAGVQGTLGLIPMQEGAKRAREATEKALAIDPVYAPAHARLGLLALYTGDLQAAARHMERALALDPNGYGVMSDASVLLMNLGRLNEAMAIQEALVRRDPLDPRVHADLNHTQFLAGRFDDAIGSCRTILGLNPGAGIAHSSIADALLLKGDGVGALAELEKEPVMAWRVVGLPMAYFALGRRADSDRALADLIATHERDAAFNIAYVYAFRGEPDQTFAWLDKAIRYRDPGLAEVAFHPHFAKLHSDPRWLPFLRRIGKAPEQLAKVSFKVTLPEER